jgi:hypothetical protein
MWCEAFDDGNEAVGQLDERFRWRAGVGWAVFALRARFATPRLSPWWFIVFRNYTEYTP